MQLHGKALRVIIYIGESDRFQGKSLYMALLQYLKNEGASGATVVRGLAGFGARSRIHTATILALSEDLPLRLEWVDQPEVVERLLPQIRQMVDNGLVTVEEIDVVQYAPGRMPAPLTQPVQDVMRKEVIMVAPHAPVAEVVTLLVQRGYRSLPVVDEDSQLLGIITGGDLLRRSSLVARLDLQAELPDSAWQQQIASLRQQPETAADIMTHPVITLFANDSLRRAITMMVENDLKRLPVLDENNRLVGWISRVDVLYWLEYHSSLPERGQESFQEGTTISDLMVKEAPKVSPQTRLDGILQALELSRQRRAVVVDEENHVLGIITDGDLLRRCQPHARPGLMARLRALLSGYPSEPISLPDGTETAATLMTAPAITISTTTPLASALRLMVQHRIKRLPVVDEEGSFVGLLGRATLLRGLLAIQNS